MTRWTLVTPRFLAQASRAEPQNLKPALSYFFTGSTKPRRKKLCVFSFSFSIKTENWIGDARRHHTVTRGSFNNLLRKSFSSFFECSLSFLQTPNFSPKLGNKRPNRNKKMPTRRRGLFFDPMGQSERARTLTQAVYRHS